MSHPNAHCVIDLPAEDKVLLARLRRQHSDYKLTRVLAAGRMNQLAHRKYGHQLWTHGRVRKRHTCRICHHEITVPGHSWRPFGNGMNRFHRICEECMKGFEDDAAS